MSTVSTVVPAYNAARYLARAIDSVLAQAFDDWDLIVVDDGSTDETSSVLARYADPRIRVVRQANAGEAAARNRGLDLSCGEFVAFLDADDEYLPGAFRSMVAFMRERADCDVLFSDGHVCDGRGVVLSRLSEHRSGIHEGVVLEPLVLHSDLVTVPVCTLTRRAAIERAQARFDPALIIAPDWDFWIQLARTSRFGYLDEVTCRYRVHGANLTRRVGRQRRHESLLAARNKILSADWFAGLSVDTRRELLQEVLLLLLADDAPRQRGVLEGTACRSLPAGEQADLWRRVGIAHLLGTDAQKAARSFLRQALMLDPTRVRTRLLTTACALPGGRAAARALARAWTTARRAAPTARPVPALAPQHD